MKITTVIASGLIASTLWAPALQAQSLKSAGPPAEFPPASYKGSQYVDSRGCMYIRAGIDGVVDWVPRLSQTRKQICGQTPTRVAGTTTSRPAPQAELITLPQSQQPAAAAARVQTQPKPAKPAAAAATATAVAPAAKPAAAKPAAVKPKPVPAAAPTPAPAAPAQPACEGVSSLSAQYMNPGARCGPQESSPSIYVPPQSSMMLTPNTRVMPAHVYQQRRLSRGLEVPAGYRRVWEDDRLNGQRTVRTLKPAVITHSVTAPQGYAYVKRDDDRHNPNRGLRTPGGDQQMAMVWSNTVPRRLVELPLDRPVVKASYAVARSPVEASNGVMRLSTRSAPDAAAPAPQAERRRYVRAATYSDEGLAKAEAQRLSALGLPVRLGHLIRGQTAYKVVLAGPFTGNTSAEAALAAVRGAGFSGARLSK